MLEQESLAIVIRMGLAMFAILAVIQYILVPTLIERFRNDLFSVRRDLFIYMAHGNIEASHPAYARLRTSINAALRFAESITFARFLASGYAFRVEGDVSRSEMTDALAAIPSDEVRRSIDKFNLRFGLIIGAHFLRTSPLLWLLVVAAVVPLGFLALSSRVRLVVGWLNRMLNGLDSELQQSSAAQQAIAA